MLLPVKFSPSRSNTVLSNIAGVRGIKSGPWGHLPGILQHEGSVMNYFSPLLLSGLSEAVPVAARFPVQRAWAGMSSLSLPHSTVINIPPSLPTPGAE